MGIINCYDNDNFALNLLKQLLVKDESFRKLMSLVKENIYRNKFCEEEKFHDDVKDDLTKEKCTHEINILLKLELVN